MSRLQHSPAGLLRAIQMSDINIFAFCEGKRSDPYFYSEIMRAAEPEIGDSYRVEKIDKFEDAGGKMAILSAFRFLREAGKLSGYFKGKKFSCVFFVDKDADCICGRMERDKHLIYTKMYDVEAHLYFDSDLARALAIALSISINDVPAVFLDPKLWCEGKAVLWKEWLALCVYSQVYMINCECGYSRASTINGVNHIDQTDMAAFHAYVEELYRKHNLDRAKFDEQFAEIEGEIVRRIAARGAFALFKGKWMGAIIQNELKSLLPNGVGDFGSLPARVSAAAMAHLDFGGAWVRHYLDKIQDAVVAHIGMRHGQPA